MDLLGSILNSMDAPPKTQNKQTKEEKEKLIKLQAQEKKKKVEFRAKIHFEITQQEKTEKQITELIQDGQRTRLKFPPMNRVQRSIVHDVAEVAGLTTFSFGEDEVDRYVMVFKKEFPPSDEELEAYRNGEEFNEEDYKKAKAEQQKETPESSASSGKSSLDKVHLQVTPTSNYKDKYKHLLGEESGKVAARITKSNAAYGVVPSENKRDQRSIEETLNDIRARKKQKLRTDEEGS